jgi:hypothetical protein
LVRWERQQWGDEELARALIGGLRLVVAVEAGPVHPWVGVEPMWRLAGTRASGETPIGDEAAVLAGLGVSGKVLQWGVGGSWRDTSIGPVVDVGVTVHVRPR